MKLRKRKKVGLRQGSAVVYPTGLQEMLGISAPTRWRWEKEGKLPKRDFKVGDRTGWKRETAEAIGKTGAAV